ncbi:hypothetical protein A0H81_03590 [Grifola frondosa]|uniref:WIBG Mago-binding domain-containing protein n=1 Tax=Grifola frondosa TaxID=5627 RepID=A0A1C7MIR2_GRIFR|nr:hypothetical protein A0H81_03590 [Grifola frondosa]
MSKPAIIPEITAAGIAVDPRTLERVIPESRRPDGTVRKQIKIRLGIRHRRMATSLAGPAARRCRSAKGGPEQEREEKREGKEKRKEKHEEEPAPKVKDSWEDEDEDEEAGGGKEAKAGPITEKAAESKDNAGARQKRAMRRVLRTSWRSSRCDDVLLPLLHGVLRSCCGTRECIYAWNESQ